MSRTLLFTLALLRSSTLLPAQQGPYPGWGVYSLDDGVTAPRVITMPRGQPMYPGEAFGRNIQGKVRVAFVVRQDGMVDADSVKVTCSVDPVHGLDKAAVNAARQIVCKPGLKDGEPVAVRTYAEFAFSRGTGLVAGEPALMSFVTEAPQSKQLFRGHPDDRKASRARLDSILARRSRWRLQ